MEGQGEEAERYLSSERAVAAGWQEEQSLGSFYLSGREQGILVFNLSYLLPLPIVNLPWKNLTFLITIF